MTYAEQQVHRRATALRVGRTLAHITIVLLLVASMAWCVWWGLNIRQRLATAESLRASYSEQAATVADEVADAKATVSAQSKVLSAQQSGRSVANAQTVLSNKTGSKDITQAIETSSAKGCGDIAWVEAGDSDLTWTFESTAGFEGGAMPVCWEASFDNGQLTALVTATYDSETDTFSDVRVWSVA